MEDNDREVFETTNEHFTLFKDEAQYWIAKFGLFDWDIEFKHEPNEELSMLAWCAYDNDSCINRYCQIGLNQTWAMEVEDHVVKQVAFHEVLEVLLLRIGYIAKLRDFNEADLIEEIHVIIRRFENTVFKDSGRV